MILPVTATILLSIVLTLSPRVQPVKDSAPLPVGIRGFPELSDAAIRIRRPGYPVPDCLPVTLDSMPFKFHFTANKAPFQNQQRAGVVYPGLVPDLAGCVIDIQTLTAVTVIRRVMFVDNAITVLLCYPVETRKLSIRLVYLPLT
jgi:hypothetical protein